LQQCGFSKGPVSADSATVRQQLEKALTHLGYNLEADT
jgi:hypothetical protein